MDSVARSGTFSSAGSRPRHWVYMSLMVVTPARAISQSASSAPHSTLSGVNRASIGKMRVLSQVCSSKSSAEERNSTMGRCVCPLTKPGINIFLPLPSITRAPVSSCGSVPT